VRVNSDKQTLILAGEPVPRRDAMEVPSRRPVTLIATRVDAPVLLIQATASGKLAASDRMLDRGSAFKAVRAYARTQQPDSGHALTIDTYA
jgi:hypothetical protein